MMLAAQLAFLALSSQSSGVPLLSGYWGSSLVPISTALPSGELGRSRLGGRGFLASAERVRPQVGFRRVGTQSPLLNSAAQLRIQWSLFLLVS